MYVIDAWTESESESILQNKLNVVSSILLYNNYSRCYIEGHYHIIIIIIIIIIIPGGIEGLIEQIIFHV